MRLSLALCTIRRCRYSGRDTRRNKHVRVGPQNGRDGCRNPPLSSRASRCIRQEERLCRQNESSHSLIFALRVRVPSAHRRIPLLCTVKYRAFALLLCQRNSFSLFRIFLPPLHTSSLQVCDRAGTHPRHHVQLLARHGEEPCGGRRGKCPSF